MVYRAMIAAVTTINRSQAKIEKWVSLNPSHAQMGKLLHKTTRQEFDQLFYHLQNIHRKQLFVNYRVNFRNPLKSGLYLAMNSVSDNAIA